MALIGCGKPLTKVLDISDQSEVTPDQSEMRRLGVVSQGEVPWAQGVILLLLSLKLEIITFSVTTNKSLLLSYA